MALSLVYLCSTPIIQASLNCALALFVRITQEMVFVLWAKPYKKQDEQVLNSLIKVCVFVTFLGCVFVSIDQSVVSDWTLDVVLCVSILSGNGAIIVHSLCMSIVRVLRCCCRVRQPSERVYPARQLVLGIRDEEPEGRIETVRPRPKSMF